MKPDCNTILRRSKIQVEVDCYLNAENMELSDSSWEMNFHTFPSIYLSILTIINARDIKLGMRIAG